MSFNLKKRLEIYKKAQEFYLKNVENDCFEYGLCEMIYKAMGTLFPDKIPIGYMEITLFFPELMKFKPEDIAVSKYWWDFDEGGVEKREEVLESIIDELKENEVLESIIDKLKQNYET